MDILGFESCYADWSIFLLCNFDVLLSSLSSRFVNIWCWINGQQVTNVVTVQLQELNFDVEFAKLGLSAPVFDLFEEKVEDARHDTNLLYWQAHRASRSHRMSLSRACLTIG